MKIETYSHNGADKIVSKEVSQPLIDIIAQTNFNIVEGCAKKLRKTILLKLNEAGWSNDFKLNVNSQISLTSSNKDIVLCLQTGNMSRFYADLMKIQFVYQNKKANSAIYIIPSKHAARLMGSNIAHYDRLIFEVNLFKQIITVPILVIGIN